MKKIMMLLMMCVMGMSVVAQTTNERMLEGSWSGKLNAGRMVLSLVFHITWDESGNPSCTFDSPDQSVRGMATKVVFIGSDSIHLEMANLGASYFAKLKNGELDGTFVQMGYRFPLVLKRGEEKVRRPQHPVPPYPYITEEVTFENKEDGATLAGTLTYPEGYKNMRPKDVPVLLMVTGSGQENRDEEIFDHKPFWVIADFLARHGIATLRYDDRNHGQSKGGEVAKATTADFMRDARAGLNYLRSLKKFGKIGVLGHSEGASIAFMLGAEKKADFIISMAGVGMKGDSVLTAQVNRMMELNGMKPSMTVHAFRKKTMEEQIPWLAWFIDYDPTADISKTTCPVLAINGEKDSQVLIENLSAIRRHLPANNKNLLKEYPSLNHLFQHCETGATNEYRRIEETISPEVLQDMAAWIDSLSR
ncbi:MAG: alpha/beta hydrolase [Prevotella sp.]|nr:alpha/beta hydrolase [Prevotella sp.]